MFENQKKNGIEYGPATKRRVIFEGAIYHITQRAPGKELVFLDTRDYLRFLHILKNTVYRYNLEFYAFALLPNHVHLLLQIKEKNLSSAMKHLFEKYAKYFNKKYTRKGHVFCGRFRSSLCNDDTYLLAASVYIHLNAYRAGLCTDAFNYRWTSLRLYMEDSEKSFVTSDKILLLLDANLQKARQAYIKLIAESIKLKPSLELGVYSLNKALRNGARMIRHFIRREADHCGELSPSIERRQRITKDEEKKARQYTVQQLLANGYSYEEIQERLGVSRATLYRIIKPA